MPLSRSPSACASASVRLSPPSLCTSFCCFCSTRMSRDTKRICSRISRQTTAIPNFSKRKRYNFVQYAGNGNANSHTWPSACVAVVWMALVWRQTKIYDWKSSWSCSSICCIFVYFKCFGGGGAATGNSSDRRRWQQLSNENKTWGITVTQNDISFNFEHTHNIYVIDIRYSMFLPRVSSAYEEASWGTNNDANRFECAESGHERLNDSSFSVGWLRWNGNVIGEGTTSPLSFHTSIQQQLGIATAPQTQTVTQEFTNFAGQQYSFNFWQNGKQQTRTGQLNEGTIELGLCPAWNLFVKWNTLRSHHALLYLTKICATKWSVAIY